MYHNRSHDSVAVVVVVVKKKIITIHVHRGGEKRSARNFKISWDRGRC
jgi:hypothetical protein